MFKTSHLPKPQRCALTFAAVVRLGAAATVGAAATIGMATLAAQTVSPHAQSAPPAFSSQTSATPQASLATGSDDAAFSSSSASSTDAAPTMASLLPPVVDFNAMQYGGGQRQRYGRPRYRGNNTNADGSSKYVFFAGAGLSQSIGNTFHYLTPSYGVQVGGGRQFSRNVSVPIQFDYDHFGFAGQTLGNQLSLYTYEIGLYNAANPGNQVSTLSSLDGSSHVWSFSVDPTYTISAGEGLGAYVVVGAGFYHKTANFTTPGIGEYCDPYYGCYTYQANQTVDKYTSNAPGFSGGFGLTYKFSRFSNERFYGEVRYVFVDNSQRSGVTIKNATPANANVYNEYPANSNRTTYIPIKVGLRF